MKGLAGILHPTFETLSAWSDLEESQAAAMRLGRHVERCAQCRAVVGEIRALGVAARARESELVGPHVWDRILAVPREDAGIRIVPRMLADDPAARIRARLTHRPVARRALVLTATAAAAILLILALPRTRVLEASSSSALTFSPGRPRPGSTVKVTYRAASWLEQQPKLLMIARFFPVDQSVTSGNEFEGVLADSIAILRRTSSSTFEGSFQVPANFLGARLSVVDTAGESADKGQEERFYSLLAGDDNGKASLPSFLAALDAMHMWYLDAKVADSLLRYFPNHPAGYVFKDYDTGGGLSWLTSLFDHGERKYSFLDARYAGVKASGIEFHYMALFAQRLAEPALAAHWVTRLVREHPESQYAFADLVNMLHKLELREPRALADSVRPWLPLLDTLYRQRGSGDPEALVERYGTDAQKAIWRMRAFDAHPFSRYEWGATLQDTLVWSPSRVALDSIAHASQATCVLPRGRYLLGGEIASWKFACEFTRSSALLTRAQLALRSNDARSASILADSAIQLRRGLASSGAALATRAVCISAGAPYRVKALAEQKTARVGEATDDFARAFARFSIDSASTLARSALGHAPEPARFASMYKAAKAEMSACSMDEKRKTRALWDRWRSHQR